jgi:hypothetical protein
LVTRPSRNSLSLLATTTLQHFLFIASTLDTFNPNLTQCGKKRTDDTYRANPSRKITKGHLRVAPR